MSEDGDVLNSRKRLYPVGCRRLPEEIIAKAKQEIGETEEKLSQSLKIVKELLKKQEVKYHAEDDHHLCQFLRARKFDYQKTVETVQAYAQSMRHVARKYGTPDAEEVKDVLRKNIFGALPYKDDQGRAICFCQFSYPNGERITRKGSLHALLVLMLFLLEDPGVQLCGLVMILNMERLTFFEIPHAVDYVRTILPVLKCDPARFSGIHITNEGTISRLFVKIARPLLPKKVSDRIVLYGSHTAGLQEHFHPSILPHEFSGTLGPLSNQHWMHRWDYFIDLLSKNLSKYAK